MRTRRTGDMQAQRPDSELWATAHRERLAVGPIVRGDTDGPVDVARLVADVTARQRHFPAAAEHPGPDGG